MQLHVLFLLHFILNKHEATRELGVHFEHAITDAEELSELSFTASVFQTFPFCLVHHAKRNERTHSTHDDSVFTI
eukprot:5396434-Amphidinium_carterae.2